MTNQSAVQRPLRQYEAPTVECQTIRVEAGFATTTGTAPDLEDNDMGTW
jgi:hypothetical protein